MMKSRFLLLLLMLSALVAAPATAMAVDEPTTSSSVPSTTDSTTDPTSTAPITLDQEAIDALNDQGDASEDNQSALEKASDFVTDNAPWFIIGIIVLAAIIAGILIMKGRPRNSDGTPKASKSNKAMRDAGGLPAERSKDQPAQVPSASELRRRKRAAIQRSREEERLRRKAEIENRKAARRGEAPVVPVVASAAGAAAVTATGAAVGGLDPVEAEKQGARDQEVAAGAMARFDAPQAVDQPPAVPEAAGQTIPAPVSPSQTAPAAGVITPDTQVASESIPEPEPVTPEPEPAQAAPTESAQAAPDAETNILHEPSIESPGADAAVGNAAQDFLAGGAAGAAAGAVGGLAAARASRPDEPVAEEPEPLEPVISPEPGMAPEHALAEPEPVAPVEPAADPVEPAVEDEAAIAAEERLRAKVAEIKATQAPAVVPAEPEPEPPARADEPSLLGPDADLSPGLAAVERKLSENSEERDRALRDAEERLRRVEQRAEDAERRAAFAERLAQLKVEESEREKRLNDVVSGIDRAEQRAREAEARAEAAERAAAAALEQSELKVPAKPVRTADSAPPAESAPAQSPEHDDEPPAPEAHDETGPVAGELVSSAPERKGLFGGGSSESSAPASDSVNLNSATFEELREAGLSVTQATRILAYRERFGGYDSVDDLEKVPGFPSDLITSLRGRISV
ncbi:MAG: helix-hairpin-helix domain-containing protein [Solirubrobacterales bacterium]|nr:helix-hairpin-helix domain-containing protein [Solirubrobacterales bacterium]